MSSAASSFPSDKLMGGRFKLVKELAKGQFGEALLVRDQQAGGTKVRSGAATTATSKTDSTTTDPSNNKLYVVKRIMAKCMTKGELKAALAEIKTISALHHKHIVKFHQSWKEDGHVHLRMEYCDGGDMQQLIKSKELFLKRPLPESLLTSYFIQILEAAAYMHERHVIHRDLKLANIFLTENQKVIKIGDFGLSKLLSTTDEAAKTQAGTPYYFSPEIAAGEDYTTKTDIFSLGVLFFELMTRRKPFDGRSITAVLHATRFSPTPDIRTAVELHWGKQAFVTSSTQDAKTPLYSKALCRMIGWMLEKDPANRPSALQLLGTAVGCSATTVASLTTTSTAATTMSTLSALATHHTDEKRHHLQIKKAKAASSSTSGHLQHLMLAQPVVLNVRKEPKLDSDVVGKVSFRDKAIITVVDETEQDNTVEKRALGGAGSPVPETLLWYKLARPLGGWMIADLANGKPLFSQWQPDAPPIQRPTSPPKPRTMNHVVSPLRQQRELSPSPVRQHALQQQAAQAMRAHHHHQPLSPVNANLTPRQSPLKNRFPLRKAGGPAAAPHKAATEDPLGLGVKTTAITHRDPSPPQVRLEVRPFARTPTADMKKTPSRQSPMSRALTPRPRTETTGTSPGVVGATQAEPKYQSPVTRALYR